MQTRNRKHARELLEEPLVSDFFDDLDADELADLIEPTPTEQLLESVEQTDCEMTSRSRRRTVDGAHCQLAA